MRFSLSSLTRFLRFRRHCSHAGLVAFQCASLDEAAARRTALHVSSCPRCSSQLHLIREDLQRLEQCFAPTAPLATIAAADWTRLCQALQSHPSGCGPSPRILAAYLGEFAGSPAASAPHPTAVLQTLLGARAAAAVSAAVLDHPDPPEASR